MKTLLANHQDHSQKTKDGFIQRAIGKSGYKNTVSNFTIKIYSHISETDLEELEFIYPQYKILTF